MNRAQEEPSRVPAEPPARLPCRERLIVWGGISAVTAISWVALARMPMPESGIHSRAMGGMTAVMNAGDGASAIRDIWLIFAMWTVMMAAMMLPSVCPTIEMYARIARGRNIGGIGRWWLFLIGYLIAWTGFSAAITAVQYGIERTSIIAEVTRLKPLLGGLLLIAAGIYQFTPLKQACLTQCRSPLGFFMTRWRSGRRGALAMGLRHGVFCVGCCWLLMALMFIAGVMNLLWAAVLAVFVLLEKATPWGSVVAWASGGALVAFGLVLACFG